MSFFFANKVMGAFWTQREGDCSLILSRQQVPGQSGALSSANEEAASNAVTPDFSRTGTMVEAYRNLRSCAILIYPYFLRTTYLYQDALSILSRDSSVDWSLDSNTSSRTEAETLTKIIYILMIVFWCQWRARSFPNVSSYLLSLLLLQAFPMNSGVDRVISLESTIPWLTALALKLPLCTQGWIAISKDRVLVPAWFISNSSRAKTIRQVGGGEV